MWFVEPEKFRADELAALVAKAIGAELHVVLRRDRSRRAGPVVLR